MTISIEPLNNPGQMIERICRMFFVQEKDGYIPAPREYIIADQTETAKQIEKDSYHLKNRFERFVSFFEEQKRQGKIRPSNPIGRKATITMFALGCEMIERKIETFTDQDVLNLISRHCGLLVRLEYHALAMLAQLAEETES